MPKKILADVRPANRKKIKRRYRLLIGTHVQKELLIVDGKPVPDVDADGKQLLDENGAPAFRKVSVLYKATPSERPTFETEIDGDQNCLVKRFGADKYQRLDDDGPQGRQRIWDPERETVEEFAARVKAEGGQQSQEPRQPPPTGDAADGLDKLTVDELRELAESKEVDVEHIKRKDDLIQRLRESKVKAK